MIRSGWWVASCSCAPGPSSAHTHFMHMLQESLDFDAAWRSRVSEYEASVATQLCNLKQQHEAQLTELLVRCESDRPSRPSTAQRYLMAGRLRRCWSSRWVGGSLDESEQVRE